MARLSSELAGWAGAPGGDLFTKKQNQTRKNPARQSTGGGGCIGPRLIPPLCLGGGPGALWIVVWIKWLASLGSLGRVETS